MVVSLLCAGMTVVFFIITNVNEVHWKFAKEESMLEISSKYRISSATLERLTLKIISWPVLGKGGVRCKG